MTWPSSDVSTAAMDGGTDTPPRAEFKSWADKFNEMRNHVSALGQTLINRSTPALMRADLEVFSIAEAMPLLRNYHQGFAFSTSGPSSAMTIGAGQAADSGNAVVINLSASINKTTGSWAVGSGNGGLDTGTIAANTWYYFHVIRRPDTGVVDVLISLSATAPTMPANYTQRRLLLAWRTDAGSTWHEWKNYGDEVVYQSLFTVGPTSVSNVTRNSFSITVPNVRVLARLQITIVASASGSEMKLTESALSDSSFYGFKVNASRTAAFPHSMYADSQTIGAKDLLASGNTLQVETTGFNFANARGR